MCKGRAVRWVARMQQVAALDFRMHTNIIFGAAGGRGRGAVKVQLFNKLTIIRKEGEGGTTALGIRFFTLRRAA